MYPNNTKQNSIVHHTFSIDKLNLTPHNMQTFRNAQRNIGHIVGKRTFVSQVGISRRDKSSSAGDIHDWRF